MTKGKECYGPCVEAFVGFLISGGDWVDMRRGERKLMVLREGAGKKTFGEQKIEVKKRSRV